MNERHFTTGLMVTIRPGATPSGLTDWDEEDLPSPAQITGYDRESDTYEVAGWWWSPQDLDIV